MAKVPADLKRRIERARTDRDRRRAQINDYLRLVDPTRPRIGDDLKNPTNREEEVDDLFDTTLQEVSEDFASDVIGRVMPRDRDWLTYAPVTSLGEDGRRQLEEPLRQRTAAIFDAIRGSNLYDEALGEWALDQGHGTGGIIVTDPGAAQPFFCQAIPPHQLLLGRGGRGLNFRGRECAWEIGEAVAHWPDYDWPDKLRADAADPRRRERLVVVGEYATLIPDPGVERHRWQVVVDGELVHDSEVSGRGSCPIVASRWRSVSSSAWGIGPLLKAVPDGKSLDQLSYLFLKNLGKQVDPPAVYDDDGVLNPEGGIGAGQWIPRVPGSKVDQIEPMGRLDAAFFEAAQLTDKIRRAGYQYGPRQRGKTPPTAFQWADEKAEEGRRLEMPTGKLYAEAVVALVERFEYLLVKRGAIDEVLSLPEVQAAVRVRPLNPLARQQDFESVQTTLQLLNGANAAFGPQATAAIVDARATLEKMKDRTNDENLVMLDAERSDEYLRGVLGQPGDAPGLETAPGAGGGA